MLRVQIPSLTPNVLQACSFNRQNVGLQNRSSPFKSERACQFLISNKEQRAKVFASLLTIFSLRKISLIGKAVVLKTIAQQVACGFESCIFRQILLGFVAQRNQSARIRILRLRVQILPKSPVCFGVVQPAGRLTLNQETKVRILSPKPNLFISGRSADDDTDLPWEQVFAGLNPAAQTNLLYSIFLRRRSPTARGTGLRNQVM